MKTGRHTLLKLMKIKRIFSIQLHTVGGLFLLRYIQEWFFTGGNEETWTYLFDNGLKDIDQENRLDTFPIQIACIMNNSAALKFLLDKKANIDVKVKV